MSFLWPARDLQRGCLSSLMRPGAILMLQAYFDDSGKAGRGDRVVVWGGVVGFVDQFDALESAWDRLLRSPLPGKRPLKSFHLTDCRMRINEFDGYSAAESDHVQFLFRQAILDAEVMPVAFGVDVAAWNDVVVAPLRAEWGSPEALAFGSCFKAALEMAEDHESRMLVAFDNGAMIPALAMMRNGTLDLIPDGARRTIPTQPEVSETPGLQAADVVANLFFRYASKWIESPDVEPEPHFRHLLDRAEQQHWAMFGRDQISDLVTKVLAGRSSPSPG
jgi:hypothetical protein